MLWGIYLFLTGDIQDDSVGIPAFHRRARQPCRCSLLDNCWNLLCMHRSPISHAPLPIYLTCTNTIALCTQTCSVYVQRYPTICLERCTTTDL
ncbi:hypothetical protein GHT06_020912 [Daphnia sinensis]|uniref:Uncharacterized protein n=1 Tax=Daphnia sinensis TaxID=1820382 RepID=A0AAD5L0E0_9CRUS|nr:hypothetical protein GHT06_020912 [Daphnia sinensis]